jgi:hypothetical protein
MEKYRINMIILGIALYLGLTNFGKILGDAAVKVKEYERTVKVKGLSEREYPADIVIWPIQFTAASNTIEELYKIIDDNTAAIKAFLEESQIPASDITAPAPAITDKSAQQYNSNAKPVYRFTGVQTVNVYSGQVALIRNAMIRIAALGKKGIVFSNDTYYARPEYIFTRLNDIKPKMIEEATKKAREVAQKFASDSQSSLGKIKRASQGQFSIDARDNNNPHIKKIRVVSTVEYYLSD